VEKEDLELGKFDPAREPQPKTSEVVASGVEYAWGSSGVGTGRISYAPGHVFKEWGSPEQLDKMLVENQARMNSTASLYIAKQNNVYPNIPLSLKQNNRFIDICPNQFVYHTRDAGDNPRNIAFAKNIVPTRVTLNYDSKLGFMSCEVVGEGETIEDLSVTGTVPAPAPPDEPSAPIPLPTFPPIPWPQLNPITYTWPIDNPAIGEIPGPMVFGGRVAIAIAAGIVGGTSVTFNIEVRSVFGTPGTDILATDLVATTTDQVTVTLANPSIPNKSRLFVTISDVVGVPTYLDVTLAVR
jgi:hypothetical protein